jgi:hypothetical protein
MDENLGPVILINKFNVTLTSYQFLATWEVLAVSAIVVFPFVSFLVLRVLLVSKVPSISKLLDVLRMNTSSDAFGPCTSLTLQL